ncbi:MAG: hypothetical protein LBT53_01225 [Puniceicoccales bacterium]|nr:hypothetical protein [Puniceicoccales bacterium]
MRFLFSLRTFASAAAASVAAAGSCYAATSPLSDPASTYASSYAVVISEETHADPAWKSVADALLSKYPGAKLIVHDGGVSTALEKLAAAMPRHTAFVARPKECTRDYIADIHHLTRLLDDDPWLDTQWGVITGENAAGALRLASAKEPLVVKKALATTGLNDRIFEEYFLIADGGPAGSWHWKKPDGSVQKGVGFPDKNEVFAFAEQFESGPDLVVTSSHGYENGVEMPLTIPQERRGILRVAPNGRIYPIGGLRQGPAKGAKPLADTQKPKVWFPVGNCLLGHVLGEKCMTTALLSHYGVNQFPGYTVNTWFGRGGWAMLGYWSTLPGRNTLTESFFFNQQNMLRDIHRIDPKGLDYRMPFGPENRPTPIEAHVRAMYAAGLSFNPQRLNDRKSNDFELTGLLWDFDTVAFYGDPAWRATLDASREKHFLTTRLESQGNTHTFTVDIRDAERAAKNGTPIGVVFTGRLKNIKVISGSQYQPLIADNFIMLFNPRPAKIKTDKAAEDGKDGKAAEEGKEGKDGKEGKAAKYAKTIVVQFTGDPVDAPVVRRRVIRDR